MKVGNLMIPKYTQVEISKRIHNILANSGLSHTSFAQQSNYNPQVLNKLLNPSLIWTTKEYQLAAKMLETTPEQLLSHLPQEELDSVSFRALENTDEINVKVKQLDDIFQLLTYQLKIGSDLHD